MGVFISSIITGFLGVLVAYIIRAEGLVTAFALIGFSLPYAITLDRVNRMLEKIVESQTTDKTLEDKTYDVSTVSLDKCPACYGNITSSDRTCPSCGLNLLGE